MCSKKSRRTGHSTSAAIIAVVFPVTVPALAKVVESLLVIGGIGQRASYCGI